MIDVFTEEIAHLEELATILQRRRRVLEIQRSRLGELTPASTVLELEDTEQQLAPLKPGARPLNALAATLAAEQQGRQGDIASIREALRGNKDALLLLADGLRTGHADARPRLNERDQRFLDASRARRQAQIEAEQARIAAEEAVRQRHRPHA